MARWMIAILMAIGSTVWAGRTTVDLNDLHPLKSSAVVEENQLVVTWPSNKSGGRATLRINLDTEKPLIAEVSLGDQVILRDANPWLAVTIGTRNLNTPAGWMIFFDNPRERPYRRHAAELKRHSIRVWNDGYHTTISVSGLVAGPFTGEWEFTVFDGTRLIRSRPIVKTDEPAVAYLYDAGLVADKPLVDTVAWKLPDIDAAAAEVVSQPASMATQADVVKVCSRMIAGSTAGGSIALFPPPHQYLYPLDFAENYGWVWQGVGWPDTPSGSWGIGIRQPPEGDKRWVPWVNAPPASEQRLAMFILLSPGDATAAMADALKFTRGDRFDPLPGFVTFTSHYHIEHTYDLAARQAKQKSDRIPIDLVEPGFVKVFKALGVQIVHLAEFHDGLPKELPPDRLKYLRLLHHECRRLSDESLLLLPGEEPNVHLGGHWISLFPKPVLWTLDRKKDQPLEETVDGEKVYHVGSGEDVLAMMEAERGLMWTAHARIKGSFGYPDVYSDKPYFLSDRFLGFAWKHLPADYSERMGKRVLDLLDDADGKWRLRKQAIGEVDVFRVRPGYEMYGHMNVNYLKLRAVPKFSDGWAGVVEALRGGKFFVTTGEILIPLFTVDGVESGGEVEAAKAASISMTIDNTFPLERMTVIAGNGEGGGKVIHCGDTLTPSFHRGTSSFLMDLTGMRFVRLEVIDVAGNVAFTQPVWVK